jgi:hypothetical protein
MADKRSKVPGVIRVLFSMMFFLIDHIDLISGYFRKVKFSFISRLPSILCTGTGISTSQSSAYWIRHIEYLITDV